MTDNVENPLLEHLKRFQTTLERMERKQDDMANRLTSLESHVGSILQHLGHLAVADATQQLSIDNVNTGLDRIERRLELTH